MFTKNIWDGFEEKTVNGHASYLFESILPLSEGFAGPEAVEQAFRNLASHAFREQTDCRIRVYDGEQRRDDLIDKAFTEPFQERETLTAFMQRLTAKERFSLVINNLEQASPRLAADFGRFIRSFFEVRGMPIGGVEQAAFCGNYAGTAFGIHEGFEHAFLCHLGPGVKDFYCWTREEYLSLAAGREPTFADDSTYQALLKTGKLFVLKPGDVLYLPASVYHIGRQNEYSVSVALPFYTYPLTRFLSLRVIPDLSEKSLPFDKEGISVLLPFSNKNPLPGMLSQIFSNTLKHWCDNDLPEHLDFHWHRLVSNGGWELPRSISAKVREEQPLLEPVEFKIGQHIRLCEPYQISHQKGLGCTGEQRRIFAGARSVVMDDSDGVHSRWLENLNSYRAMQICSEQQRVTSQTLSRTGCIVAV